MSERPKIKVSRLREIGWSLWDPIGLREHSDGDWRDGGPCADEYDTYLLKAAGMLRQGEDPDLVADYLEQIEVAHMGMRAGPKARERIEATVAAIAEYLATLPPARPQDQAT